MTITFNISPSPTCTPNKLHLFVFTVPSLHCQSDLKEPCTVCGIKMNQVHNYVTKKLNVKKITFIYNKDNIICPNLVGHIS